ncbi:hypothetical protein GCM10023142_15130 [Anaerocolumna aminovalerica]|uniref:Uncharacterized protein n=1 Tax=Anaerocolumna aminovalerica TaxID=1527 RepID=A0A1I5CE70_9FIRM|nr:hypothetical protein [Anaerocolumna aminovalerica]SFN85223.1 hypothetical protein SAMN04489757_1036 [Anaerocolumna aminovalerica]
MKTHFIKLILVCLLAIFTVSFGSCSKESESTIQKKVFTSKNYNLVNENYNWDDISQRTFEMNYGYYNNFGIGFETGLFTAEEEKEQLNVLLDDLKQFISVLGPMKEFDLYIVQTSPKRASYSKKDKVFLLKDDFLAKEYHVLLMDAYELKYEWSGYGLNAYVSGDKADESMLKDYYLNHDSMDCLELLPIRFIEEWNTQIELDIAKKSAISLTKFVLEEYDIQKLNQVDNDIRTKWLEHIGVNKEYQYSYGDIGNYSYSKDTSNLLVVDSGRNIYNIKKISGLTECSDDVEKLLYFTEKEIQYINSYLLENLPAYEFDFSSKRNISTSSGSVSTAKGNLDIDLTRPDVVIHEYMHTVFPLSGDLYSEALSEYFGKIVCNNTYWQEAFYKNYLLENKVVEDPVVPLIQSYYYSHHKKPLGFDEIDRSISIDAIAYASITADFHAGGVWRTLESTYGNRMKKEGMELNFWEATSFFKFLINQYSLDTVMNAALTDISYKDAYEKEYEILKEDWIQYLNEKP